MADPMESLEDRVKRVMNDRGLTWAQAWAAIHDELTPEEIWRFRPPAGRGHERPKIPGAAHAAMWCGLLWPFGVIALASALVENSTDDATYLAFFVIGLAVWLATPITFGVRAIRRISASDGQLRGASVAWAGILSTTFWMIVFGYAALRLIS